MAVVSDQTIASAAKGAGFPADQIATAVAVALAESGGDATATNTKNKDGSTDYGLWQINSVHKTDLASGNWRDPNDNARMAFNVWSRAGRKWTPWVAYNNGRHLPFMSRGAVAAGGSPLPNPGTGDVIETDPASLNPFQGVADAAEKVFKILGDKDLWIRIGMGLLGSLILAAATIGLLWTLGGDKVVKAVNPLGKVGKVGKIVKGATS